MKTNPNLGPLYPMQFEVPNCDNGTKSCHCGEGSWIRGAKAWNSELGKRMKDAWALFYKVRSLNKQVIVLINRLDHSMISYRGPIWIMINSTLLARTSGHPMPS